MTLRTALCAVLLGTACAPDPFTVHVEDAALERPVADAAQRIEAASGIEFYLHDSLDEAGIVFRVRECDRPNKRGCSYIPERHWARQFDSRRVRIYIPEEHLRDQDRLARTLLHELMHTAGAGHIADLGVMNDGAGHTACITEADLVELCDLQPCAQFVPEC